LDNLGSVIAKARRRKKWSQRKLAQVTGLSRSFINDIEHGRSTGTVGTWIILARALGLSLDEVFLGEQGNKNGLAACGEKRCGYCVRPANRGAAGRR